jgi:hypothetical protein
MMGWLYYCTCTEYARYLDRFAKEMEEVRVGEGERERERETERMEKVGAGTDVLF